MQNINIGASEYDGLGESIRSALNKVNLNFTELFAKGGFTISTTEPDSEKYIFYHNPSSGKWFIFNKFLPTPAWTEVFQTVGGSGSGTSNYEFFNQTTEPIGAKEGDDWYQPDDGVVYKYINDGGNLTWVDL